MVVEILFRMLHHMNNFDGVVGDGTFVGRLDQFLGFSKKNGIRIPTDASACVSFTEGNLPW